MSKRASIVEWIVAANEAEWERRTGHAAVPQTQAKEAVSATLRPRAGAVG